MCIFGDEDGGEPDAGDDGGERAAGTTTGSGARGAPQPAPPASSNPLSYPPPVPPPSSPASGSPPSSSPRSSSESAGPHAAASAANATSASPTKSRRPAGVSATLTDDNGLPSAFALLIARNKERRSSSDTRRPPNVARKRPFGSVGPPCKRKRVRPARNASRAFPPVGARISAPSPRPLSGGSAPATTYVPVGTFPNGRRQSRSGLPWRAAAPLLAVARIAKGAIAAPRRLQAAPRARGRGAQPGRR